MILFFDSQRIGKHTTQIPVLKRHGVFVCLTDDRSHIEVTRRVCLPHRRSFRRRTHQPSHYTASRSAFQVPSSTGFLRLFCTCDDETFCACWMLQVMYSPPPVTCGYWLRPTAPGRSLPRPPCHPNTSTNSLSSWSSQIIHTNQCESVIHDSVLPCDVQHVRAKVRWVRGSTRINVDQWSMIMYCHVMCSMLEHRSGEWEVMGSTAAVPLLHSDFVHTEAMLQSDGPIKQQWCSVAQNITEI